MTSEQGCKDFETWAAGEGYIITKGADGDYLFPATRMLLNGWLARASLSTMESGGVIESIAIASGEDPSELAKPLLIKRANEMADIAFKDRRLGHYTAPYAAVLLRSMAAMLAASPTPPVSAPSEREPGTGWTLTEEAKAQIRELEINSGTALARAGDTIVGAVSAPSVVKVKELEWRNRGPGGSVVMGGDGHDRVAKTEFGTYRVSYGNAVMEVASGKSDQDLESDCQAHFNRILSALTPSSQGVNAVEVVRKALDSEHESARREYNALPERREIATGNLKLIGRIQEALKAAGIPDTSTEGK